MPTAAQERTHTVGKSHTRKTARNMYHGLYGGRWRGQRRQFLSINPLCVYCLKTKKTVAANVVDHIIDHKGNILRFWDQSNWQALCKRCHDTKTGQQNGFGARSSAMPTNNDHERAGPKCRQKGKGGLKV